MDDLKNGLWEVVARAAGMAEANLITGRLASDGIPAQIRYEAAGQIYAITIDGLGEVQVLVPVAQWERARNILCRSYEEGEIPWRDDPAALPGREP
jgi:hypothetical protein